MKDFYKYLIIIFVGVVLFLLLNSQDNFNVGGIAWAVSKPTIELLNIESKGGWGEWDDYNYYFNNDLTDNEIKEMFPRAKIIQGFPSYVENVSRFSYKIIVSEDDEDYPAPPWNNKDIEYIAFPPLFDSCVTTLNKNFLDFPIESSRWREWLINHPLWNINALIDFITGQRWPRPSLCDDQLFKTCGLASMYDEPADCVKCALRTCDKHPALYECGNCMARDLQSYCSY
tara:strand:+ start:340 stop:1026 length:687 start_codon:yes stop_codon:yes gene_type:complete